MNLTEENKEKFLNNEIELLKDCIEDIWYLDEFPLGLELLNFTKETWKRIHTEEFKEEYYNLLKLNNNIDIKKPNESIKKIKNKVWKLDEKEIIDSNCL